MYLRSSKKQVTQQQNAIQQTARAPQAHTTTFQLTDNRTSTAEQRKLHQLANANHDIARLQTVQALKNTSVTGPQQPIQRMQLIANEIKERENDITILNNIAFARSINKNKGVEKEKIGSLFDKYSAADLDTENGEIIFVHGHGLPGFFLKQLSKGDIKDDGDEKGYLSWDETAKIITSNLKGAEAPLTIRMLSCHGAEPSPAKTEGVNPRGFVDAMVDYMAKSGLTGEVTAYNDPVISWGTESGISLKAGKDYDAWLKTFETKINTIKAELKKKESESNTDFDYQQRLNFIRVRIANFGINNEINEGFQEKKLVVNPPVIKMVTTEDISVVNT